MKTKTLITTALIIFFTIFIAAALGTVETHPVKSSLDAEVMDSALTQLSAATSLSGTDVMYAVVSGASKKISWSNLMAIIRDSIETQPFTHTGRNIWTGGQFNLGSWGTVDFYDTVVINTPNGVFAIEGNAKGLIYGEMNYVSGAKLVLPAIGSNTTYGTLHRIGSDGTGQMTFNYGTSLTDTVLTKRTLRSFSYGSTAITAMSLDSVALAGGTAGLSVTANVMVVDGNATPSSISLEAPIYDGQELILICPPSDANGFTLIDTDGGCELIGDANKSMTASDVIRLIGYNGIWYQTSAVAAN